MSFSTQDSTASRLQFDSSAFSLHQAATSIQKHWRGYSARRALKISRNAAEVIQKAWSAFADDHTCFICLELGDRIDRVKVECCEKFAHLRTCLHPWFTHIRSAHCPHCRQDTRLELPEGVVARDPAEPINLEGGAHVIDVLRVDIGQSITSIWHWTGVLVLEMAVVQNLRPFADVD